MKKTLILLTTMILLVGCIESVAIIGGGASNGKLVQSSLQSAGSYGIKKTTGKTPLGHIRSYTKKQKTLKEQEPCSSFAAKKDLEICLMIDKKITTNQINIRQKLSDKTSAESISSLRSSINKNSKIKYLD